MIHEFLPIPNKGTMLGNGNRNVFSNYINDKKFYQKFNLVLRNDNIFPLSNTDFCIVPTTMCTYLWLGPPKDLLQALTPRPLLTVTAQSVEVPAGHQHLWASNGAWITGICGQFSQYVS